MSINVRQARDAAHAAFADFSDVASMSLTAGSSRLQAGKRRQPRIVERHLVLTSPELSDIGWDSSSVPWSSWVKTNHLKPKTPKPKPGPRVDCTSPPAAPALKCTAGIQPRQTASKSLADQLQWSQQPFIVSERGS